jgi:hypothetical protein
MSWFFTRSSSHNSSHRPSYARSSSSIGSGFFSRGGGGSSSHYKRRPRDGYVSRLFRKLKHFLRELMYYARRNPVKLFMFVVMPLVSGGALAAVAKQFGVRLPDFLNGKSGAGGRGGGSGGGGGYYGSKGYGGGTEGIGNLMSMAKMFL